MYTYIKKPIIYKLHLWEYSYNYSIQKNKNKNVFSKCLLRHGVLCVFVSFCVFLYGPFCHGALKLDISMLFITFFL